MNEHRKQWVLALLVLLLVPFALHARLLRGEALLAGDVLTRMHPWTGEPGLGPAYNLWSLDPLRTSYPTTALADELGDTRWNAGILLGEPVGMFLEPYWDYPPQRLVHFLFPAWLALGLYSWLSIALGGWVLCAYLARGRGLPLSAAVFGALAYELCTWGSVWLGAAGLFASMAPWAAGVLWAAESLGQRPGLRGSVVCGLCLGGALWASFPPAVVPLCGVLALGALTHASRGKHAQVLGWVALAGAVGLAAGGLRLVPAALQFLEGTRIGGGASEPFRLQPIHALTCLAPDVLGHPLRGFNLLGGPREPYANHVEVRLYVGLVVALFAALGLIRAPRRTLPWAAVAACAVLLASATPFGWLWGYLPGLRSSTPTRLLGALHLIVPVLAAEGFAQRGRAGRGLLGLSWAAVVACVALGLLCGTLLGVGWLVPASRPMSPAGIARLVQLLSPWGELALAEGPGRTTRLLSPTLGPLLLASACLIVAWIGGGGRTRRRIATALWAALMVGDLLREGLVFVPATPKSQLFPETPGLRAAREAAEGGRVLLDRGWWSNTAMPCGMREVGGYTPVRSGRVDALLRAGGATLSRQSANPRDLRPAWRDALAVRAVLAGPAGSPTTPEGLTPGYAGADCAVWLNPSALPRVRAVAPAQQRWVADRAAAEAAIAEPGYDPRVAVVLEGVAPPGSLGGEAQVSAVEDGASSLSCQVVAEAPTLLLIADAYDGGWRAWVGDSELELYPANVGLRAVVVPAGGGELRLTYSPRGWWLGLLLSLGTVGLSAFVLRRCVVRHPQAGNG